MINLYPHQTDLVSQAAAKLIHGPTLIQGPTGIGKTVIATRISQGAYNKNNIVWFICHRRELVKQTVETFRKADLPTGIIASGHPYDPSKLVYVCSIDTLRRRVGKITPPKICIWDEAHHVGAATWSATMQALANSMHIGLSATPRRNDGTGLGQWFDHIVQGPSVGWLIENNYLSPYKAYAPSMPDASDLKFRAGEYTTESTEQAMNKPTITGCAISEYKNKAYGQQAIVFCTSVQHSKDTAEAFKKAGVFAVHLDGTTPDTIRDSVIASYKKGDIKVLTNVGLFGEGFDVPAASCLICLRPTASEGLWLQMCGRVLRYVPGKEAVILDHAGNFQRHGFPCEEREWSLDAPKRKKKDVEAAIAIRQCSECYHVHKPATECPDCGYVYPIVERVVDEVEGELVELEKKRKEARREQGGAKTLDDLIAIGIQRKYKNPRAWAQHVLNGRRR